MADEKKKPEEETPQDEKKSDAPAEEKKEEPAKEEKPEDKASDDKQAEENGEGFHYIGQKRESFWWRRSRAK